MLKITGNTYLHRKDLYKLGCRFVYEGKYYLSNHNQQIIDFCINNHLQFENHDEDIKLDENFEIEQKNIRARQKAEKYQERAEILEVKANETTISQQERDFLSLGEPIKIGHHSEGRHRKLLDRVRKTYNKQHELYNKSNEYDRKAQYRSKQRYYTEAEKAEKKENLKNHWQRALDLWKSKYKVGDMYIGRHCSGIIKKINNKSVILDSGTKMQIGYSQDFDLLLKETQNEKKND